MLQHTDLCKNNAIETSAILLKVITNLYGSNPDNLEADFFKIVTSAIYENFKNITLNDLQEAFKSIEIEKKPYSLLTRDEILMPIKQYWKKKNLVLSELNKCREEENEESDKIEKELDFYNKAKALYIESLKNGEWLGDAFYANVIAKNFKNKIEPEVKKELWNKAQSDHKKSIDKSQNELIWSFIPEEKIYSDYIIRECIKLKLNFIEKNI